MRSHGQMPKQNCMFDDVGSEGHRDLEEQVNLEQGAR